MIRPPFEPEGLASNIAAVTALILGVLVLAWVAVFAVVIARGNGAKSVDELWSVMGERRRRAPTSRGWSYWLNPNVARGECWPLWYWLLVLVALTAIGGLAAIAGNVPLAAVFLVPALATVFGVYRRLRYGFRPTSAT